MAIAECQRAIKINEMDSHGWFALGNVLDDVRDWEGQSRPIARPRNDYHSCRRRISIWPSICSTRAIWPKP